MKQIEHHRNTLFSIALLLFTIFYAIGLLGLLAGLTGSQYVPEGTSTTELVTLSLLVLVGGVGIVGIFLWKKWGVYLLLLSWILTVLLNVVAPSLVTTTASSFFVLFAFVFGLEIGRSWKEFE